MELGRPFKKYSLGGKAVSDDRELILTFQLNEPF